MIVNFCFHVFGATIADLDAALLKILWKRWFLGKCSSSRFAIKPMRWKAFFYEQGSNKYIPENYGLKSLNYPAKIK